MLGLRGNINRTSKAQGPEEVHKRCRASGRKGVLVVLKRDGGQYNSGAGGDIPKV